MTANESQWDVTRSNQGHSQVWPFPLCTRILGTFGLLSPPWTWGPPSSSSILCGSCHWCSSRGTLTPLSWVLLPKTGQLSCLRLVIKEAEPRSCASLLPRGCKPPGHPLIHLSSYPGCRCTKRRSSPRSTCFPWGGNGASRRVHHDGMEVHRQKKPLMKHLPLNHNDVFQDSLKWGCYSEWLNRTCAQ